MSALLGGRTGVSSWSTSSNRRSRPSLHASVQPPHMPPGTSSRAEYRRPWPVHGGPGRTASRSPSVAVSGPLSRAIHGSGGSHMRCTPGTRPGPDRACGDAHRDDGRSVRVRRGALSSPTRLQPAQSRSHGEIVPPHLSRNNRTRQSETSARRSAANCSSRPAQRARSAVTVSTWSAPTLSARGKHLRIGV